MTGPADHPGLAADHLAPPQQIGSGAASGRVQPLPQFRSRVGCGFACRTWCSGDKDSVTAAIRSAILICDPQVTNVIACPQSGGS